MTPDKSNPTNLVAQLWQATALPGSALDTIVLPEQKPLLPSSFDVGAAAQASIGAAALAASCLYQHRCGQAQVVEVSRHAAELECTGYFRLDGKSPNAWEKFSGLYPAADGHVRIHANFDHHRDGILDLLKLGSADEVEKEDVEKALATWTGEEFETAAARRGLVATKVRTFDEWDQHPHAKVSQGGELVTLTRLDNADPEPLSKISPARRPLSQLRILDLTRILAGPICGRTLAAYGADVMLINSPELPNIPQFVDTGRGKRSVCLNLAHAAEHQQLKNLVEQAHVFVQGYRPGGLSKLGFSPQELAHIRPGIICTHLSAYGSRGPWADRRGFDSLVQSATGFNHAEAEAAGADQPRALPIPILDFASGFLMAFGTQAALLRQQQEGGSWLVEVSLLQTARWLRGLGRIAGGFNVAKLSLGRHLSEFPCTMGKLEGMPHAARFSHTPAGWQRPSTTIGAAPPVWD